MAELIWSEASLSDVENIYDYIFHDSPQYARYQAERIVIFVERLRHFPESGRRIPEFPQLPYREIIVGNYRVVYSYDLRIDEVKIVAVVHGSRLLRKTFLTSED